MTVALEVTFFRDCFFYFLFLFLVFFFYLDVVDVTDLDQATA